MAEGGTCQGTERNQPSEGHSHTGDGRGRGLSEHGKKRIERRVLTNWRWQREGLVRTWKEIDRSRGTHSLETAEGGACQDIERNRLREGHSLPGDGRGRDLSGHGNKSTEQRALTLWRRQKEEIVRIRKETNRAKCTHSLEKAEDGICQDMERNPPSEGTHNLEMIKGRGLSGHGKKPTSRGALTPCKQQREGLVTTRKETDQARGTHPLETVEGGTFQDKGKNRPSQGYSLPGKHKDKFRSGHVMCESNKRAMMEICP